MCKIKIEECIKHVNNKFDLVLVSAKRARNLASKKDKSLVKIKNEKETIIALKEIENGYHDNKI